MKRPLLFLKAIQTPVTPVHTSRYSSTNSSSLQLKIGDKSAVYRRFSSEDVQVFADLSGDHNPIHLDEEYAAKTRYKQRIVHGLLTVGWV
jgi:acyl dehydratase